MNDYQQENLAKSGLYAMVLFEDFETVHSRYLIKFIGYRITKLEWVFAN